MPIASSRRNLVRLYGDKFNFDNDTMNDDKLHLLQTIFNGPLLKHITGSYTERKSNKEL